MELLELQQRFNQDEVIQYKKKAFPNSIGGLLNTDFSEVKGAIVVFCVAENRANGKSEESWTRQVREQLYSLFPESGAAILDWGNLKLGSTYADTLVVLQEVTEHILKQGGFPLVMGGGHDLTKALALSLKGAESEVHLGLLDAKLDVGDTEDGLHAGNFLSDFIINHSQFVYDIHCMGVQRYFVDPEIVQLWNGLNLGMTRLGECKNTISTLEPCIRDLDVFSIDLGVLELASFSGANNGPNGINAWEFCQISKYAGMADRLQLLGLFGLDTTLSANHALLLAEFVWCFVEGYAMRVGDYPVGPKDGHRKFTVTMDQEVTQELMFFQSTKSGRWWFQAPPTSLNQNQPIRKNWVSCSYEDYQSALENKIPALWWKWLDKNA
ncbi:MAG: formiminoglutamase [Sphingobacteriales bacterium]|jgi:formiminoglutamase